MLGVILWSIGLFSLVYYVLIVGYAGFSAAFAWFWLAVGCLSSGVAIVLAWFFKGQVRMSRVLGCCLLVVLLPFIIVEYKIISYANTLPASNADYVIVLGAKVNGSKPSKTLNARIKSAIEYLQKNPESKVIVSGGQGIGEDITEALAMSNTMIEKGIDVERIILEDKSTNTKENILFSKELIKNEDAKIVIVSSDFHIYRGVKTAKKLGFMNVTGCPSKSDPILVLNYYIREFFAVVKDSVIGNM